MILHLWVIYEWLELFFQKCDTQIHCMGHNDTLSVQHIAR